ncbi:AsmA family protein [Salinibacter sp.]|uniref:AsmA family protein n=1 Tax=Salinibacter sp. TaxID=2065818 RepID=UPI0021E7047B|nr:AsmA family protein [Salinibacter sp.]
MPDEAPAEASRSNPGRSRRLLKWGWGLLGGLLVLVLAAALLLPRLFPSEQLKGYVVPPLEAATGRQVHIDAIGLRVLPAPAVRVSGFRLANAEGYGPAPAVEARALTVDVALWPLFLLDIRPTAVALEAPVVRYEVGKDGATNFDDLGATDTTAAAGDESPLAGIPVSSFRVSEAQMHYTDRSSGQALRLDLDAQLSARADGAAIRSEGTVDLRSVRALLPSVGPDTLAVQDARATYDVRVAPADGQVDLRSLQLDTAPLTLSAEGALSGLGGRPAVDLTFETGRTNLAEIAAFAPAAAVAGVNPQGTLALEGTLTGPLADTTEGLALSATGQLAEAGVDYEGAALLRDLSADLSLTLDSVAARSVDGRLLGASLAGDLSVRDLGRDPRIALQLTTGAMNLADLAAFAPPEEVGAYNPQGTLRLDVTARGPVPSDAASMRQLAIDGSGRLAGGGVDYEGGRSSATCGRGSGFRARRPRCRT